LGPYCEDHTIDIASQVHPVIREIGPARSALTLASRVGVAHPERIRILTVPTLKVDRQGCRENDPSGDREFRFVSTSNVGAKDSAQALNECHAEWGPSASSSVACSPATISSGRLWAVSWR